MDILFYIAAGAGVGFAVGLTGVGGGSLMTPLLILSGIPEKVAIGTDLLYAAVTKSGGAISHARQQSISWNLVALLAAGSIPASLVTTYALHQFGGDDYGDFLTRALGFMLIVTAGVILFRWFRPVPADATDNSAFMSFIQRHSKAITLFAGVFMGIVVTLSSVGAGAFCAVLLMTLFPKLPPLKVVGTDIAHAVPLTLIGGLGHFFLLNNIDFELLTGLLIGSLPAVYIGSKWAARIPGRVLQPILGSLLFGIGCKFVVS